MGSKQVTYLLNKFNIDFCGYIVNEQYYNHQNNVFCLQHLFENSQLNQIIVIVAFKGYNDKMLSSYSNKIKQIINMDCFAGMTHYNNQILFSYQYILQNKNKFQECYNFLFDDLSKNIMVAYCNQKISMNYKYLENLQSKNQNIDSQIVKLKQNQIFVDCGAYNGDSALCFVRSLQNRGIKNYKKIISFQPNNDNFKTMKQLNLKNHVCMLECVSDKIDQSNFLYDGASSRITINNTQNSVKCTTIDTVLKQQNVTFIKMDIEGYQLSALIGAKNTIINNKPILAICVYHKPSDLIQIPKYIKSLVPQYKFFLRSYEKTATEIVLYAII